MTSTSNYQPGPCEPDPGMLAALGAAMEAVNSAERALGAARLALGSLQHQALSVVARRLAGSTSPLPPTPPGFAWSSAGSTGSTDPEECGHPRTTSIDTMGRVESVELCIDCGTNLVVVPGPSDPSDPSESETVAEESLT